jgi:hypothetical protein
VSGATKLNVRIQLSTWEGHIVVEQFVEGDVRFMGNNLRTTHNLAHNVAVTLKRSTLPESAILAPNEKLERCPSTKWARSLRCDPIKPLHRQLLAILVFI